MKPFIRLFILIFSFISVSSAIAQTADLSEFGVKTVGKNSKEARFEKAVEARIGKELEKFVSKDSFRVSVKVRLSPEQKAIANSKRVQLGMLGTVLDLKPPRHITAGSRFIDRIEELKLTLYVDKRLSDKITQQLLDFSKEQLSFVKGEVVVAEVKPLYFERNNSWEFLKDFQILIAAFFLGGILLFGFRYMTEQIQAPIQHMMLLAAAPEVSRVELLPGPSDYLAPVHTEAKRLFQEEEFFKLPLQVQQAVVSFSTFSTIQEVYTLLNSKYKKLFWSCMPQEYQLMPENELIKQACVITDVEQSPAWAALCHEVYNYVKSHPEVRSGLHPDVAHYFAGTDGKGNEKAS